jgi:rSAM/selenodomain-associated transferase 2
MNISIIIPIHNEAKLLGNTIENLLLFSDNTVKEIIVVDHFSTDDSAEIASNYEVKVLQSPKGGRGAQLHFGAQNSTGNVLYFVHADTLPPKDFIKCIHHKLSRGWKMGAFSYQFRSKKYLLKINSFFTQFKWFFTMGGDRSFYIDRNTYFKIGGYNPECKIMEDYDFLKRAKKMGFKYTISKNNCSVSSRKYDKNSWLKVQLSNLLIYNLWSWGIIKDSFKLKKAYRKLLRI